VSTARIAKQAEFSEGLIFKHFSNKRGLLDIIYADLGQKLEVLLVPTIEEKNPQKLIGKYIDGVFEIDVSDYPFWKLKLKWENDFYKPEEIEPLVQRLTWAFIGLKYPTPKLEATMLIHTMENLFISILRDGIGKNKHMRSFLKKKYKS